MQGKGGFLRILEAFIAIAMIAGVMSFLYVSQVQRPNQEEGINQLIRIVLEKISSENDLRKAVLDEDISTLETEINQFIVGELGYKFSICELDQVCKCESGIGGSNVNVEERCPKNKNIFSDEISISVAFDSTGVNPKALRLFVWEK